METGKQEALGWKVLSFLCEGWSPKKSYHFIPERGQEKPVSQRRQHWAG